MNQEQSNERYRQARAVLQQGDLKGAERLFEELLRSSPDHFATLVQLAVIKEQQRSFPEAISLYERATAANPGHALPFTRRSLLKFKSAFDCESVPKVTMRTLGSNGRFGNQLLQYFFLRMYAQQCSLHYEVPEWIGRYLFDLRDALATDDALPSVSDDNPGLLDALHGTSATPLTNVDLVGYFNHETSHYAPYRELFRRLYQPGHLVREIMSEAINTVRTRGKTLVALHLRRGDFGYGQFWVAPEAWYVDWLERTWRDLESPVLYIATDDPAVCTPFAQYEPLTMSDLGEPIPGAEFFHDWFILTQADLCAASNSTFSFTASMANQNACAFVRPILDQAKLVAYDPWNARPFLDSSCT